MDLELTPRYYNRTRKTIDYSKTIVECKTCKKKQNPSLIDYCYHGGMKRGNFYCSDCMQVCKGVDCLEHNRVWSARSDYYIRFCISCLYECVDCSKKLCESCGWWTDEKEETKRCDQCKDVELKNHSYVYIYFICDKTKLIPDIVTIIYKYTGVKFDYNVYD
jgi:hypothetical protein